MPRPKTLVCYTPIDAHNYARSFADFAVSAQGRACWPSNVEVLPWTADKDSLKLAISVHTASGRWVFEGRVGHRLQRKGVRTYYRLALHYRGPTVFERLMGTTRFALVPSHPDLADQVQSVLEEVADTAAANAKLYSGLVADEHGPRRAIDDKISQCASRYLSGSPAPPCKIALTRAEVAGDDCMALQLTIAPISEVELSHVIRALKQVPRVYNALLGRQHELALVPGELESAAETTDPCVAACSPHVHGI